ncbi:MAG TPA: formate dehydrogenase accessory protein FdhE [Thermoanaerobaculia bacterium]|nr:formate dehydrogenase accessory protein FdhE [Thermoanaerobaculia bacterium]
MISKKWDQRIERARELARQYPFATEALRFYENVASFQKSLYEELAAGNGSAKKARPPGSLRDELELFSLLPWFGSFLAFVEDVAPAPLASTATELKSAGSPRWELALDEFWRSDAEDLALSGTLSLHEAHLAWVFLQPYAEHLADSTRPEEIHGTPSLCPLCYGKPQAGVLRPLGDGAKRSLICSLCATEWEYRRLVCPACGEEDVNKLPVYVAEEITHVRVEACDTCRHYIKTIDLTKTGHAVPVVDELAAIPLSLWAEENRYEKVSANLVGI